MANSHIIHEIDTDNCKLFNNDGILITSITEEDLPKNVMYDTGKIENNNPVFDSLVITEVSDGSLLTNDPIMPNICIKPPHLIGSGVAGMVIYPPIQCKDINIKYADFIGKIHFKLSGDPAFIKNTIIDKLPDEFDTIAYYKESYICPVKTAELYKINGVTQYYGRLLPAIPTQLILKRVIGNTIDNILTQSIQEVSKFNNCQYYDLLESAVKFYNILNDLANRYNVFHNDINPTNLIYDIKTHKIMFIDFDSITFEKKKKKLIGKLHGKNYIYVIQY